MLNILVAHGLVDHVKRPLCVAFEELGVSTKEWAESEPVPIGTHAMIVCSEIPPTVGIADDNFYLIVIAHAPCEDDVRCWLLAGASGVIDCATTGPMAQAIVAAGVAAGGGIAIPRANCQRLFRRLEAPPEPLRPSERQLLALASWQSIESAGQSLELSRRQTQRKFHGMCQRLGLASRFEASLAAARWGLVDTRGQAIGDSDVLSSNH